MEKVRQFMDSWAMLPQGGIVLCAVSGGADSMCLLDYLRKLADGGGFSVVAAHFNHRLRGAAADADEAFVREWCERKGIKLYTGCGDVRGAAEKNGWSIEEAARSLRYAFLEETADAIGAVRIATAHNADDNAETLLLNLARGTGAEGMGGIPPVRGRMIRPFLCLTRREIEAYLAREGIAHVEDATNEDDTIRRNRVRHAAMPALRDVNERAAEHMSRTALLLRKENEYMDAQARGYLRGVRREGDEILLPCRAFADAPEVLRVRMVRLLLDELGAQKKDITAEHMEKAAKLALRGAQAQVCLPRGLCVGVSGGIWRLYRAEPCDAECALIPDGTLRWGLYEIRCRYIPEFLCKKEDAIYIKCDTIGVLPQVGAWRARAGMRLPGAKGKRSLKRLFVDAKICLPQREQTPVFYVGGEAAAVWGIGTAEGFEPRSGEKAWEITASES